MRLAFATALLLLLAGCKGSHDTGDVLATGGDVLAGSASDAMIPYDTLRSQAQRLSQTAGENYRAPADERIARVPPGPEPSGIVPSDSASGPPPPSSVP